jgi:hypothetical protein
MTPCLRPAAVALLLLLSACRVEMVEPLTPPPLPTTGTPAPTTLPATAPAAPTKADAAVAPGPSEQEARRQIDDDAWAALKTRDFAALERTAAAYRDPAQRTPSGSWKLTIFYVALSNYLRSVHACLDDHTPAEALFAQWEVAVPDSPTLPLVRANYRLCMAHPAGGQFDANALEAVRADLEARRALADTDPYWDETMLRVGAMQGWPDPRYLTALQEAARRQPGFNETWYRAVDYAALQVDADDRIRSLAMMANGFAPSEGLYARIYSYAARKRYGDALFDRPGSDWTMLGLAIDDLLGRYPSAWNANHFARLACRIGDRRKTQQLMRLVALAPVVQEAWDSQEEFERCRDGRFGDTPTASP